MVLFQFKTDNWNHFQNKKQVPRGLPRGPQTSRAVPSRAGMASNDTDLRSESSTSMGGGASGMINI